MQKIIIIAGATATYKSQLALFLADKIKSVIINCDAIQVYKEIPLISAQPTAIEKNQFEHKLYGYISGSDFYSVGRWFNDCVAAISLARENFMTPIIVGGSGMYINALVNGFSRIPLINQEIRNQARVLFDKVGNEEFHNLLRLEDPMAASRINIRDKNRLIRAYEVFKQTGKSIFVWHQLANEKTYNNKEFIYIVSELARSELYNRCDERFLQMIENGAVDEVNYIKSNFEPSFSINKAIGINEIIKYLDGEITLHDAIDQAQMQTRRYAKRQITWFKNQINDLEKYNYSSPEDFSELFSKIKPLLGCY